MAEEKKPWWYSTYDAFDTFLRVPGTVTRKGAHVRDGIDLKRVMIMVVIALVPAALFGMYKDYLSKKLAANKDPNTGKN